MKMLRKQERLCRLTATVLCLCMAVSMFAGLSAPRLARAEGATGTITPDTLNHVADPSTLYAYIDAMNLANNTRMAGRIWADKTVLAVGQNTGDLGNKAKWDGKTLTLSEFVESGDEIGGSDDFSTAREIPVADVQNADFLHVFSAIGSSQEVDTEMARPLDVVLLLDISTSMTTSGDYERLSYADDVIEQANILIGKLLNNPGEVSAIDPTIHSDNRVGVVVYGGGSQIVMPLAHYKKTGTQNYLTIDYGAQTNKKWWPIVTARGTNTNNQQINNTSVQMFADSTYLQGALYQGMNMLATANGTTYTKEGRTVDRRPILIVLTDGGTNVVGANTTGAKGGAADSQKYGQAINFYDPLAWTNDDKEKVVLPNADPNGSDYMHYCPVPNGNPFYASANAADGFNYLDVVGPRSAAVLLTAGFMKKKVEAHYNEKRADKNNEISMMGFGIGFNVSKLNTTETQQLNATMDPKNFVNSSSAAGSEAREAYDLISAYARGEEPTASWTIGKSWLNTILSASWTFTHPTGADLQFDVTSIDDVYYIDTYQRVEATDVRNLFNQILENITSEIFVPVQGENELGVEDQFTYVDPIGKYMNVKDVQGMSLFGHYYELVPAGIYDYSLNNPYMVSVKHESDKFSRGWYLKLTDAEGKEYLSKIGPDYISIEGVGGPNDVEENRSASLADVLLAARKGFDDFADEVGADKLREVLLMNNSKYANDGALEAIAADENRGNHTDAVNQLKADARAVGWEFYFDLGTASEFVPTLSTASSRDQLTAEQQSTVYTFYRFEDDKIGTEHDANLDKGNPSYGSKTLTTAGDHDVKWPGGETNEYFNTVFSLNDIRVWVEDSGDYVDEQVSHSGFLVDTSYDEALYMSFPVEALPLWVAKVETEADGTTVKTGGYTTNTMKPLRLFYTVGVEDDLIVDNQFDLTKINRNYLYNNKDAAGRNVYFYSNWYNKTNRYDGYSATTGTEVTFGDTALTFSPSEENRFYVFQKALPLYNTIYKYEGGSWKEYKGVNDGTADHDDATLSVLEGTLIAKDLNAADASEIPSALSSLGISSPKEGNIVLLAKDILKKENVVYEKGKTDPFPSKDYFFMAVEYYDKEKQVEYVVSRKSSEFGSAYAGSGIKNGDMLCWYDESGTYTQIYPYLSKTEAEDDTRGWKYIGLPLDDNGNYVGANEKGKPAIDPDNPAASEEAVAAAAKAIRENPSAKWVVAAKPGGLRTGNMARNVRYKGTSSATGPATANNTGTAGTVYVPTISSSSTSDDLVMNLYLGNNGRLEVGDTLLMVTKRVQSHVIDNSVTGGVGVGDEQQDKAFKYQVSIGEFTGEHQAISVRLNHYSGKWQRQVATIDVHTNNHGLLLMADGSVATVNDDGTYNANGEYYLYIPDTRGAAGADTGSGFVRRIFINEEAPEASAAGGNQLLNTGRSMWVKDPPVPVASNGLHFEQTISDQSGNYTIQPGTTDYWITDARVVSKAAYDAENARLHGAAGGEDEEEALSKWVKDESKSTKVDQVTLLRTVPPANEWGTEIQIGTNYNFDITFNYLTKTVVFGKKLEKQADGTYVYGRDLTKDDIVDQTSFQVNGTGVEYGTDVSWDTIAAHTAEFMLKDGEGLLFNGINFEDSTGSAQDNDYRVTECIDEDTANYGLRQVTHIQQSNSTTYTASGNGSVTSHDGTAYVEDAYRAGVTQHDVTNGVETGSIGSYSWYAHFGENAGVPYYSITGDTDAQEEAVHFVNFAPVTLKTEPIPGEGQNVRIGQHINYDIYWQNTEQDTVETVTSPVAAQVKIVDVLDKGVNFVSASYDTEMKVEVAQAAAISLEEVALDDNVTMLNAPEDLTQSNTVTKGAQYKNGDPVKYTDVDDGLEKQQQITITYTPDVFDPENPDTTGKTGGTVTWLIENALPEQVGKVMLEVEVNPSAVNRWHYGDPNTKADSDESLPDLSDTEADNQLENRGYVQVGNNPEIYTNVVHNPVGGPDKTETNIYHDNADWGDEWADDKNEPVTEDGDEPNLNPKGGNESIYEGPMVRPGDVITYKINWENSRTERVNKEGDERDGNTIYVESDIYIRDPLDPNVELVGAYFLDSSATVGKTWVLGDGVNVITDPVSDKETSGYIYQKIKDETSNEQVTTGIVTATYGQVPQWVLDDFKDSKTKYPNHNDEDDEHEFPDKGAHTVFWKISGPEGPSEIDKDVPVTGVEPHSVGEIYLVVRVKEGATVPGYVDNQAYVQVENEDELHTRIVENPVPTRDKDEIEPGAGQPVGVGDTLTYEIAWRNTEPDEATVIVTDKLDPGVDFKRAVYPYIRGNGQVVLEKGGEKVEGDGVNSKMTITSNNGLVTITYYPPFDPPPGEDEGPEPGQLYHTVVWEMRERASRQNGLLTLETVVNDKAEKVWSYDDWSDLDTDVGEGKDLEVFNQASVKVGEQNEVLTKVVENPVEQKTETDPGLKKGDPSIPAYPGQTGDAVEVGQNVTYALDWKYPAVNEKGEPAEPGTVTIVDKLDPGVKFASAALGTAEATETKQTATGEFTIKEAVEGVSEAVTVPVTITYYPTAEDGHYAHSVEWVIGTEDKPVPAGTMGQATLTVEVTEAAKKQWVYGDNAYEHGVKGVEDWSPDELGSDNDLRIVNQARFEITEAENKYGVTTGPIYNPVGQSEKEEVDPGDGEVVTVGQPIEYTISWQNNETDSTGKPAAANVVITDKLDPGVDFVSAEFPYVPAGSEDEPEALLVYPEKTEAVSTDGKVTIRYYPNDDNSDSEHPIKAHTVVWTLTERPAGSEGLVGLTVRANANAQYDWNYETEDNEVNKETSDWEVYNQAGVRVGNQNEVKTKIVENPLEAKTELTPGDGKLVGVGDSIIYKVHWQNDLPNSKTVIVTDRLDEGVDFVSANVVGYDEKTKEPKQGVTLTAAGSVPDSETIDGVSVSVTIEYAPRDPQNPESDTAHLVTWTLESVPAKADGDVYLKVKVNENAVKKWEYGVDPETGEPTDTPSYDGTTNDYEVRNRAKVQVGDNSRYTNVPENPVPGKTEVPGQSTDDTVTYPAEGDQVYVGKRIRYSIHWWNDQDAPSDVYITDPLDDGVDFVSASFGDAGISGVLDYEKNIKNSPDKVVTITGTGSETATITYYKEETLLEDANGNLVTVPARSVMWKLPQRPASSGGYVELVVKVNENAVKTWEYGDVEGETPDTPIDSNTTNDYEVRNRAKVQIGDLNNEPYYTNVPENPLPAKTETDPGDGEIVGVGEEITYTIAWNNTDDQPADIEILDPLDAGVEFVSASFVAENAGTTNLTLSAPDKGMTIEEYPSAATPKLIGTATIDYYSADGDKTGNTTATPGDKLTILSHSVLWKFKAEAHQSGVVQLKVKVTEKAFDKWDYYDDTAEGYGGNSAGDKDHEVVNRAVVSVDNNPQVTNKVENPVPEKTEEKPGNGDGVKVGDEVTYRVYWKNGLSYDADVIITDQLDNGVDFVSASFDEVKYPPDEPSTNSIEYDGIMLVDTIGKGTVSDVNAGITIHYDEKTNTAPAEVTWTLEKRPAGSEGYVELVVQVNKDAVHTWEYGDATGETPDTPERNDKDFDYKIVNRAKVQIGNHSAYTNIPENPLPEKTEVTPGEGEFVDVDDYITYQIAWKNTTGQNADIVIVDPLDDGVDFVAARFGTVVDDDGNEKWPTDDDDATLYPNDEVITPPTENTVEVEFKNDGNMVDGTATIEYTKAVKKVTEKTIAPARSVIWKFKAKADGEGVVTLKVRVNDQATVKWAYDSGDITSGNIGGHPGNGKDYEVVDRAVVDVNNTPSFTNDVHNPVPEKTETDQNGQPSPGEGKLVGVGDTVTYEIGWNNGENSEATVTITDPLDIGVTFKSASFGGVTLEKGQTSASSTDGKITIAYAYDEETRTGTVTWTLKNRPAHSSGKVTLEVTVNENAAKGWAYGSDTVGGSETEKSDQKIVNRARVQFGNSSGYTAEVENPVPEKTEETPGDGKMVSVGEEITYRVYWRNVHDKEAQIVITDPLDDGADFVSATYGGVTLSMPELPEGQTEPSGEITASDDEGNPTITITYNPAAQTANGTTQRLVTWKFTAPVNAEPDYVELKIRVNENAVKTWTYSQTQNEGAGSTKETDKDYEVINRARVEIDNRGGFTATVENPIPEKEETSPGEGKAVDVGTQIDYAIHWKNGHDEAANVIIRDKLDMGNKGVDFVSAKFDTVTKDESGTTKLTVNNGETKNDLYGKVSITYDAASDTVTWTLEDRPAKAEGVVNLSVKVNENARKPGKVENQAGVKVGTDDEVMTRIIPNPLGPSKTETHINDEPVELEPIPSVPGAPSTSGGFRGPQVNENDTVTYKVHWVNNAADENGKLIDADVKVIDPLDKGVDFVAASLSPDFEADKTLTADGESLSVSGTDELGGWSIAYDAEVRAVTWKLGNRAAGTGGDVYLTVRVNRQASYLWQYGEGDTPPKVDDNAKDNEIVNRARVIVWNEAENKPYTDVYTDVIHNPLVSGDLTVTKMVTFGGEEDREFAFRVELDNPKINGTYGDMTFKDGVAEFTLHHGQTKTAKDLPGGTSYKVTELLDDPVRYIMSATGDVGTIGETAAVAAFENHYVPPEVPKTGDDADKWFLLMLISAAGIALTALTSRRRPGDGNAK